MSEVVLSRSCVPASKGQARDRRPPQPTEGGEVNYQLVVTGEQLSLINRAAEMAARVSIGQFDSVAYQLLMDLEH